jgi:hypothetical protein
MEWCLKIKHGYNFTFLPDFPTYLFPVTPTCIPDHFVSNKVCIIEYNKTIIFLISIVGGGVQLGPLGTAATNKPIVPAPGDHDDGETGGMIARGNRSTRRKPASVPLCPPQTPHAARTRTWAAAVGSQRLTALIEQ